MIHTFLVAINVSDGAFDPITESADIKDDLTEAGHDVQSVKMWTAPTVVTPTAGLFQQPTEQL